MPTPDSLRPPSLAMPTPRNRGAQPAEPPPVHPPVDRLASLRRMTMLPEDAHLHIRQESRTPEETTATVRTGRG